MNQTQLKYVKARAESIYSAKKKELVKEYTTTPVILKTDEALEALRKGEFYIGDKPYGSSWNPSWYQYVYFNDEVKGGLDKDAYKAAEEALDTEYTALLDELVLGDNEKALELLKSFEAI